MPTHKELLAQFNKAFEKYDKYDSEKYIVEIHIVFYNGYVSHTDMYCFFIDETNIYHKGKIISPDDIEHITYLIEERKVKVAGEDIDY